MSYIIEYSYEDGNTFGSETGLKGRFEYVFNDLSKAQAALKRMKEHYEWETDRASAYGAKDSKPPAWWKKSPQETKYGISYNYSFNVVGNDGEEIWLYAGTYLGYFASLEGAEIRHIQPDQDDMRFSF